MTERAALRPGDTLSALYGAAAALARDERGDAEMLVAHLLDTEDVHGVLLAASFATLERLEAAVCGAPAPWRADTRMFAGHLLELATATGLGSAQSVNAAAWRLDAVRLGDSAAASEAIAISRKQFDDADLVAGAVAILSVMVAIAAARVGEPVPQSAQNLCLAALLAAG
ncbi:MAG: hypothetical protein AB7Q42_16070 [Acidimicrobiia bacterium]